MPASTNCNWFITISTTTYDQIDESVVRTTVHGYQKYYVVKEYGHNHTHPHLHVCLWGNKQERQDVVRRRWYSLLNLHDFPHAIKVSPITDENRLIGQYLQKDDYLEVLESNIPDDQLDTLKKMYQKIPNIRAPKRKHLTISDVADTIISYSKAHDMPLDSRQQCSNVISKMYQEGFRFLSALSKMRYIWSEIQMISGQTIDADELFPLL